MAECKVLTAETQVRDQNLLLLTVKKEGEDVHTYNNASFLLLRTCVYIQK